MNSCVPEVRLPEPSLNFEARLLCMGYGSRGPVQPGDEDGGASVVAVARECLSRFRAEAVGEELFSALAPVRPVKTRSRTLSPPKLNTANSFPAPVPSAVATPLALVTQQKAHALSRSGSTSGVALTQRGICRINSWEAAIAAKGVTGPPPRRSPSQGSSYVPPPMATVLPSPRSVQPARTRRPSLALGGSVVASAAPAEGVPPISVQRLQAPVVVPGRLAPAQNNEISAARVCAAAAGAAPLDTAAAAETTSPPPSVESPSLRTPVAPPPRRQVRPGVLLNPRSNLAKPLPSGTGGFSRCNRAAGPTGGTFLSGSSGPSLGVVHDDVGFGGSSWPLSGRTNAASGSGASSARASTGAAEDAHASNGAAEDAIPSRNAGNRSSIGRDDATARASSRRDEKHSSNSSNGSGSGSSSFGARKSGSFGRRKSITVDNLEISAVSPLDSGSVGAETCSGDDHRHYEDAVDPGRCRRPSSTLAGDDQTCHPLTHRARGTGSGHMDERHSRGTSGGQNKHTLDRVEAHPALLSAIEEAGSNPGTLALGSIDPTLADRICATTDLVELDALELPFCTSSTSRPQFHFLGTWMIWMVHRVALNDHRLLRLDFSTYGMPLGEAEERIATKLMRTIGFNTHLEQLHLADSNLQGGMHAELLAASLAGNSTLCVLDVSSNFLEPCDLRQIFTGLARNGALSDLRCSGQFCEQAGWDAFQALAEALKQNRTLRKLGMELTDPHWRDQINRGLIRNVDGLRRKRLESARQAEQGAEELLWQRRLKQHEEHEAGSEFTQTARFVADVGGA